MTPGNGSDLNTLQRQNYISGAPLDVILTNVLTQDNNGFASTAGKYYGGVPYSGTDSPDTQVLNVLGKKYHAFHVAANNATSFSVQLEGSIDGLAWDTIGTAITAVGTTQVAAVTLYKFVRANLTAFVAVGSPDPTKPTGVSVHYLATV